MEWEELEYFLLDMEYMSSRLRNRYKREINKYFEEEGIDGVV